MSQELVLQIEQLLSQIERHAKCRELDEYEANAFAFIKVRLKQIADECKLGNLTPRNKRFEEITRVVMEADPKTLPPELGARLIDVERCYHNL